MFSSLKLAVKKVVILPWVGEKEGSFKSARGGVGQGGHHGDPPRGRSMLLLHLPVVPKIEKADVSLSGSGFFFFFVHSSIGRTFMSPFLCIRTMPFLLWSETIRPLSNLDIEKTRPKKASANFSMCSFLSPGILHPAGRQRNGRGSRPGPGFPLPCRTCSSLRLLCARSQDQCSSEDARDSASITDCNHCSIPSALAAPNSCYRHCPSNRYGA